MASVEALEGVDAVVVAQLPVELAAADVQSDHPPSTVGQEDLGESARGGPDVQHVPTADVDRESSEGGVELQAHQEIGHACEAGTSVMLAIDPETVKMDQVPPKPFPSLARNADIESAGGYSPVDWYAMYPHMYVGDASAATAEKGQQMLDNEVQDLVKLIRAVKADQVTPKLQQEFLAGKHKPTSPDFWTQG